MEKTAINKPISQVLYKVRVYKDFEFPSFSIDKNQHIADLYSKSLEEVSENFDKDENYFQMELTQIVPFSIKEIQKKEEEMRGRKVGVDYNLLIGILSTGAFEKKYGVINYETNPDIYDQKIKNNGSIDGYAPYALKPEVERYYLDTYKYYSNLIRNKFM